MKNKIRNKSKSKDGVNSIEKDIRDCAILINYCNKLIKDGSNKRHTKTGIDKATQWEIASTIEISTGKRPFDVDRRRFKSIVNPDHSIEVWEKGKGDEGPHWRATNEQLNVQFAKEFPNKSNPISSSSEPLGAASSSTYSGQIVNQDNSKLVRILGEIVKAAILISNITSTLASIKIGPAVNTIKEANKALGDFKRYLGKASMSIKRSLVERKYNKMR